MYYAILVVKVKDYNEWLTTFPDISLIKNNGVESARVLQSLKNPNMAMVITEWEDLESAKKFAESNELKDRMQAYGAINHKIYFLEEKLYYNKF